MVKIDNFLLYMGLSIFLLCLLLTFIFFTPKQLNEKENLVLVEDLTLEEMKNLSLNLIEEGDLILTKPKSFSDDYAYDNSIGRGFSNKFKSFFWYNFFDKIVINSMGDTYWHSAIYVGGGKMNSLSLNIYEDILNENFLEHKYFKVLKVKTSKENKKLAIERANEHLKNQDIFYSLKNGLLIVYLESINSNKKFNIKEDELVCSGYIASIYREIYFDDKPRTHITPVDLEFSEKTKVKFLINETGFYKNEHK